jgi:hypothetical protein
MGRFNQVSRNERKQRIEKTRKSYGGLNAKLS